MEIARQFIGLNRYRDDCSALNIDNFRDIAREIYPQSLELSQENDDLTQATVLDMHVEIKEGFFKTKVYNKTDSFPFEVISLPFLESNISERICYKVFYSQVLRYQRLCSELFDFNSRVRILGEFLIKRSCKRDLLCREFVQVISNYREEFERWEIPLDGVVWFNDIFRNPLNNHLPLTNDRLDSFSQQLPDTIGHRINFFSQS